VLADKAYSSSRIRKLLRRRGIKATIPEPSNQVNGRLSKGSNGGRPPEFDTVKYKDRNTTERAFNRLRGYRAVATRYDKREFVYRGTIDVASIGIWLRHPPENDPQDTPLVTGSASLLPAGGSGQVGRDHGRRPAIARIVAHHRLDVVASGRRPGSPVLRRSGQDRGCSVERLVVRWWQGAAVAQDDRADGRGVR